MVGTPQGSSLAAPGLTVGCDRPGQWAVRGQWHPSGHSTVPPNCCCSGPVAIAMLMSQRRQEALQCWSWHLSLRRVEAIVGFSCVKSQGADRTAHFPTAGLQEAVFPHPQLLRSLLWHHPALHKGKAPRLLQRAQQKHCLYQAWGVMVPSPLQMPSREQVKAGASPPLGKGTPVTIHTQQVGCSKHADQAEARGQPPRGTAAEMCVQNL